MPLPRNTKAIALLPLMFIIGAEGFTMFAPYVIVMLTVAYVLRRARPGEPLPIPVNAN
jgi:hypothetical protein